MGFTHSCRSENPPFLGTNLSTGCSFPRTRKAFFALPTCSERAFVEFAAGLRGDLEGITWETGDKIYKNWIKTSSSFLPSSFSSLALSLMKRGGTCHQVERRPIRSPFSDTIRTLPEDQIPPGELTIHIRFTGWIQEA
ncbi:hypothetical protein RIF29_48401 [Crotalaria pallida]|uniref:Uncharacterized protein n=1 Tax=Crotalaria pallida TaxID=3830 RepID=A0AAN9DNT3_CROPI